ncbi:prolipoprotein diacylglyceryl transferase [Salsuginibacillus kocurii]|uniref:prolipoprotein diacylglyceryl transferase n=1 Tax=Salsuginibacillus kocurii TaxID=427078 RepID=UPI0003718AC6|nr:prolipoprotein diacylglyceryl transferase [Salsuginibacillus kocurii]
MFLSTQPLDPVVVELGPLTIYWYGLIIGLGALIGYFLASKETKRRGLPADLFADLLIIALPAGIIGARIYYVIFRWETYSQNPGAIFAIWEGGLAIHGGLIGAAIAVFVFAKVKGHSFWQIMDIAAPSILLAQAIGRWGNFMNQEAHGGPVSREFLEGLFLPEFIINQMYINGTYYHPTFLYESIWSLIGVAVLLYLRRVNLRQGELFLSYLIWYSIGRFFIEGMRTDSLMIADLLRTAQVVSLLLIVGAVILIIYRRKSGLADRRYLDEMPKKTNQNVGQKKKKKKK